MHTLYQVDAFAGQLFQGNPAAVVPLDSWPADEWLQLVAAENNLSETAYFIEKGDHYHLRWFTPAKEVRLCGHATLASAHVLFAELGYQKDELRFDSLGGELRVRRGERGHYEMLFPAEQLRQSEALPLISEALGVEVLDTIKGIDDYLVRIGSKEELDRLRPDFRKVAALGSRGLIVTTEGDGTDIASRCFFPTYGIDEDPVTGSAHTLLIPYWSDRLNKKELTAVQGGSRKGYLKGTYHAEDRKVALLGAACTYLQGEIKT